MSEEPVEDQDGRTAREYRIGDLARATGVPVRTLRYYQERRLLPPPRRSGRVGLYSDDHRARLRVIAELLDRGHTLEGIRDLLSAWEDGRDLGAVLGFEEPATAVPSPDELSAPLADEIQRGMDELAAMFGRLIAARGTGDHDPGELAEALARLRPAAQLAVEESFARAMDHQVRAARRDPEA